MATLEQQRLMEVYTRMRRELLLDADPSGGLDNYLTEAGDNILLESGSEDVLLLE